MNLKLKILIGILIIGVVLIGGLILLSVQKLEEPTTPITKHNIKVVYSLSGGYGAKFSDEIVIHDNGSIVYTVWGRAMGSQHGMVPIVKSDSLSESELRDFKNLILNANVFGFKDKYICFSWCPTDLPQSSLKVTIDNKTKTISIYPPGDAPEKLKEIIRRIQEFKNKLK